MTSDEEFPLKTERPHVGADYVVTKRGRSDKLSQMRLQLRCKQEPFRNEIKRLASQISVHAVIHVFLSKSTGIKIRNTNLRESIAGWIAEEEICRRTIPIS